MGLGPPWSCRAPQHQHHPLPGAPCPALPAQSCPRRCAAARESGGVHPKPPKRWQAAAGATSHPGMVFFPRAAFPHFSHLFWEGYVAFQDLGLVLQLWGGQGGGHLGAAPALTAWLCPQKAFLVPKIWERREAELGQGGPTWAQPCASPHTFSWLSRGSRVKGRVSPGSLSLVDMWRLCVGVEQLQLQPRSPPRWP